MICSKCGKELENNAKFCNSCGSKVEEKKVAEVKEVKKEEPRRSNGLGIAGMVIGIVSIILSFFLTVFILVVPIVGLILSLCSKGKKGFKITGIITNALAIVLSIMLCILYISTLGSLVGGLTNIVGTAYKSVSPYGEWTCVNYYGSSAKTYADNVKLAPDADKTILNLKTNDTFVYGPYVDSYKNYYKGNFTYEIETSKNEQYSGQGLSFIDIKAPISDAMIDGKVNTSATEMHLEMELLEKGNYDTALIMFYNSYNTYYCQR